MSRKSCYKSNYSELNIGEVSGGGGGGDSWAEGLVWEGWRVVVVPGG